MYKIIYILVISSVLQIHKNYKQCKIWISIFSPLILHVLKKVFLSCRKKCKRNISTILCISKPVPSLSLIQDEYQLTTWYHFFYTWYIIKVNRVRRLSHDCKRICLQLGLKVVIKIRSWSSFLHKLWTDILEKLIRTRWLIMP